jgi:cytochrome c1
MSIVIGRPMNGISINGLEYLMNEDNTDYKKFDSVNEAKQFLNSMMNEPLTDDELEDIFMFMDTETDFENTTPPS